jgi:hypothetical protein
VGANQVLDGNGGWNLSDLAPSAEEAGAGGAGGKAKAIGGGEDGLKATSLAKLAPGAVGESFEEIVRELEDSGGLQRSVAKDGASMKQLDRLAMGKGLWSRLAHLNGLMFASPAEEAVSLGGLAALVVGRTFLSNSIAHLNGESLSMLLTNDVSGFKLLIAKGLFLGMGQAVLGPTLEHLESHMSLLWRRRLTEHVLERYMKNQAYFKLKETMPDMADVGQLDQVSRCGGWAARCSQLAACWLPIAPLCSPPRPPPPTSHRPLRPTPPTTTTTQRRNRWWRRTCGC